MSDFPDHFGVTFTPTLHEHAKGPTLPESNKRAYNVVVTGAGKGLGYAISIAYAKAGASGICISSRTQSDLDKLSAELRSIKPDVKVLSQICDTSKPEDVQNLAEATRDAFGPQLDVVVANAGIISKYLENVKDEKTGKAIERKLPVGIIEDDDFARVTNINYLGSYYTAKYFTPLLISKENTSQVKAFVVVTSLAAQFPVSTFTPVAYNVSKVANCRMVEMMHNDHAVGDEHAGKGTGKTGLQAFAVHPGEVVTPQTQGHSNESGDTWESLLQTDIGLVGGFLTWLTSERREYLSGRYMSVHWDVVELEKKKDEIVKEDKLKFRMIV